MTVEHASHGGAAAGPSEASDEPMVQMAVAHYAPYRWVQAPTAALSLWLIASPWILGYQSTRMAWSDVLSGVVALVLATLALGERRGVVSWSISLVGLWLLLAPLVFWAPDAAAYGNDTLVGALLVAFGLLIPMGMTMSGPDIPPGWSYNPSSWPQRAPIITLAFLGFLAARYMAAYQLGHIPSAWDPFFGAGTERVLSSDVSRAWPVSDAGLGAMTYLLETLMGLMGDPRRWRTMPWMVAAFGIVVVPLGVVSIVLVMLQPVAVDEWCFLCLFTAGAMLLMIPLSLDEIVAMVQLVVRKKRESRSAWRVFWLGAELPDDTPISSPRRKESWRPSGMLWGFTGSGWLWLSALLGLWVIAAPDVLGVERQAPAADSDHIAGALVVVFAVIALAEVARSVRLLNVPLGLWIAAAPWLLEGATGPSRLSGIAAGVCIALLSLPLARLRDHYGTFDRYAIWSPRREARERHARRAWATAPIR